MLGWDASDASLESHEVAAAESQKARKRHRARHTKSRHGCYSCKSRRVKCDEGRPVCGTCASRGEPCSFPDPPDPAVVARRTTSASRTRQDGPRTVIGGSLQSSQPYREPLEVDLPRPAEIPLSVNDDDQLRMDNILLIQYFHLYTAGEMSQHPKRSQVWRRVIPELAARSRFLMHLVLALGGIHMITERLRQGPSGEDNGAETVDLRVVMEHHQRGLQIFREEVAQISSSNAETVFAGSLLLVGFIYASLQVPELNPPMMTTHAILVSYGQALNTQAFQTFNKPQTGWLHLIRGISTVIRDQWPVLKAGPLRSMVLHFHGDECWKDLPFTSSLSRLSNCSPRLLVFAQGASQAISDLKISWAATRLASSNGPGVVESPTSLPSPTTSEEAVDEQSRAIDILETAYTRIIAVLQCSISEHGSPNDSDIQANFEEAAVLAWPNLIPNDFISLQEIDDHVDLGLSFSLVILAHFYVINTLVDRWFLNRSFEGEIFKIHGFVSNSFKTQLDRLMMWPVKVAAS